MAEPDPPPPKETWLHCCPYCWSLAVGPVGRVTAERGLIRSEYQCHDCGKEFALLR